MKRIYVAVLCLTGCCQQPPAVQVHHVYIHGDSKHGDDQTLPAGAHIILPAAKPEGSDESK